MSQLFTPFTMRGLTLANRVVVPPLCQYSSDDGVASDWHMQHLPALAISGAGLVVAEMTDVEPIGRITPWCAGCDACPVLLFVLRTCAPEPLSSSPA